MIKCSLSDQYESLVHGFQIGTKRRKVKVDQKGSIIGLSSYQGRLIRLETSKGGHFVAMLDFDSHSGLVTACFATLEYCLPAEIFTIFKQRYLTRFFSTQNLTIQNHLDEWESFMVTFFSFFHQRTGPSETADSLCNDSAFDDEWESVVSDVKFAKRLSRLPQKLEELLTEKSPLKNRSQMKRVLNHSFRIFMSEPSNCPLWMFAECLLTSLNVIFESFRVMVHYQDDAQALGIMLCQFSYSMGFNDFFSKYDIYTKNYIPCDTNFKMSKMTGNLFMMDMFSLTEEMIKRQESTSLPVVFLSRFGKKDVNLFPVKTIDDVLSIYNCLYADQEDGPFRMVMEMSSRGISMHDIDSLVIGISFPIKAALLFCRSHPIKSLLPIDGYNLIGRQDHSSNQMGYMERRQSSTSSRNIMLCDVVSERADIVALRFSKDDRTARITSILRNPEEAVINIDISNSMRFIFSLN